MLARAVARGGDPRCRRAGVAPREIWKTAGSLGFLCTWADEAYGGAGCRDFRYDQIVAEEMGHTAGVAFGLHSTVVAPYLDRLGTEEQKGRLLPRAVKGEAILAIAMTWTCSAIRMIW